MQYSLWLWLASVLCSRDTGYSHLEHCTVHESWLQSCCLTGALVLWTYMLRNSFYPCDTLLARVLAMSPFFVSVSVCLSIYVCHKSVLYRKGMDGLMWFVAWRLFRHIPQCVIRKFWYLEKGSFLWNFFRNSGLCIISPQHIHCWSVLWTNFKKDGLSERDKLDRCYSAKLTISKLRLSADVVYHNDGKLVVYGTDSIFFFMSPPVEL